MAAFRLGTVRRSGRSRWLLLALAVGAVAGVMVFIMRQRGAEAPVEEAMRPVVAVRPLQELLAAATVKKIAAIEPAVHAPLVSRVGGRVTEIVAHLGETVAAGSLVAAVDGGAEPNPARAQLTYARAALTAFEEIAEQALAAAEVRETLATLVLDAARTGRQVSRQTVATSREQADLAVHQAELTLRDAQESEPRSDLVVRAADLALKAASLTQDQATIALRAAYQQTNEAVVQAEAGLTGAQLARGQLAAELDSQRVALRGQVAAAQDAVQLSHVVASVNGHITRLAVQGGDFVRPGEVVGEVTAFAGAQVTVAVPASVRNALQVGQRLTLTMPRQSFSGTVGQLAEGPSARTALWQVDIFITETPQVVQPGELVTIELPVAPTATGTVFLPLDTVTVRAQGPVLFTVDEEGAVHEHPVRVVSYAGGVLEIMADLPAEAHVVVRGGQLLREGVVVSVQG